MDDPLAQFRARLEYWRKKRGLSARELSLRIGKGESYIQALESGLRGKKLPGIDVIEAMVRELSIPTPALIADESTATRTALPDGTGSPPARVRVNEAATVYDDETRRLARVAKELGEIVERRNLRLIPFVHPETAQSVGVRVLNAIAASRLEQDDRQVEETIMVPPYLLMGATQPAAFVVVGDCLEPEGIVTGDYIIVDTANTDPHGGDIVAVRVNGEETAKLFYRFEDRIELRPAAEGYDTIVVSGEDQCEIIGVYVSSFRMGRRRR